ncbi:MAG: leucine--tRNA ligase [Nitrososphaerota archaeon]|nr:leucine--tRNA ligase [Nitrososphaerota archaeon]
MDKNVEEKWIKRWNEERVFESNPDPKHKKLLVTFPYPYMNGPLHIGHAFTSTRVDVYARYKRMQGYNVLFPWAWHWTGQPIVAAAERLSKGDKSMIKEFVEIDKIPKEELSKFYDPKYMAQYYTDSGRIALKRLGLSIDWRREFHTTDLEPTFNKFVLWQYTKLRQKGFVTRGTHPVVWCPRDQSPTGDHDRLEGQGVTWEEYTLVLFRIEDLVRGTAVYLPAATFRPETIFGVTNLWVNPDSEYAEILVNGSSHWIVSKDAVEKLKNQLKKIELVRELKGRELIGKRVSYPLGDQRKLVLLPANFVDPKNGTGVVYSVPAHAPMDYIALRDLQSNKTLQQEFGLDSKIVLEIKPISLITIPGSGEFPAKEIIEEMKIENQSDPKVDEATRIIYKKEFHQGVLNSNTLKYEGKRVTEAKPLIIQELKSLGVADSMYDLPERVVCRCLTECVVKVLEDQWFLKYSDQEWKKLAHECVDAAAIYPETARQWFHDVIDWMKDWPCARRVGLGTPLPWSPGWIVETLSDSTIYMAFYTIRHALAEFKIDAEKLTESFFDYVFLGAGDLKSVTKECQIPEELLKSMRGEFLYWYPVNLRNSAKELIPNHLTFFIFQHAAFFPKNLWPTAISANGMMMIEGEKMSKSKGNVITLWWALDSFGADSLRAALMDGAEGMDDLDWREKNARDLEMKLNSLPSFASSLVSQTDETNMGYGLAEFWLENQIQKRINSVTSSLDAMKTKSGFQEAFYGYWNDLRYYVSRTEKRNSKLCRDAVDTWIKLLAPFVPFTCEEINQMSGSNEIVSTRSFPACEEARFHPESELSELLVQRLIDDLRKILKLLHAPAKTIHIYLPPVWQYDLFSSASIARTKGEKMSDTLQAFFRAHQEVDRKTASNSFTRITKMLNELGEEFLKGYEKSAGLDERVAYSDSRSYLQRQLGLSVVVHPWDEEEKYDPRNRSTQSLPFKPALFLE